MPKFLNLYLTDNYHVKKLLQGKLGLEPKHGIYGKITETGVTRLLYFPAAEFMSGRWRKSAAYEYLEKCDESAVVVHYNAFEPSRAGAIRWHMLSRQMDLAQKYVHRCELLIADFASGKGEKFSLSASSEEVTEADVSEAELLSWACQMMAGAYSDAAAGKGIDLAYDPLIFPLLAEIARKSAGQQSSTVKKQTPGRPYNYLDLLCALDGKISGTDLTEILFDFYDGGLLTWPLATGRSAVKALKERLLMPASLLETPYEEAAMPYRYRSLPTRLYQRKGEAAGLWLLDHGDFAEVYENLGARQRLVMDMLIKRQLSLFASEPIDEEHPAAQAAEGKETWHTTDSIVRLLQIYAAGSQEDIMEIMRRLALCRYAGRKDGAYLMREDDQKKLSYLPEHLLSMDLYSQMRRQVKEAVRGGKDIGRYKEMTEKAVLEDIAKMEQQIDAAAQKEADDEI